MNLAWAELWTIDDYNVGDIFSSINFSDNFRPTGSR